MTEPRFYTSVTDPDKTAPISKEALDAVRARDGEAVETEHGGRAERGAASERGGPAERRPDGAQARSTSTGEQGSAGRTGTPAGDRGGFRSGSDDRESSFAARYVDPILHGGRDPAGRGGNGQPGYQPPAYGGAGEGGQPSSPGGVPAARSSHPPAGHRPVPPPGAGSAPDRATGPATSAGYPGQGWGGYGTQAPAGGYSSGETPSAGSTRYSPASAYSAPTYAPPAGFDPSAPTSVVGHPGAGAPGLGTVAGTGPFVGGSTLGSSPIGRAASRGRVGAPPRPARRARLLVRHIDPWSTLKFSLVLAVALFFVWLVAVGVLYGVLDGMGVFDKINGLYDEVSGSSGQRIITPGLVLGTATLVGAVNIVLMTALTTIGSFVYNICSDLVGGIEVTLAERD
jgi:hypothetical protein